MKRKKELGKKGTRSYARMYARIVAGSKGRKCVRKRQATRHVCMQGSIIELGKKLCKKSSVELGSCVAKKLQGSREESMQEE